MGGRDKVKKWNHLMMLACALSSFCIQPLFAVVPVPDPIPCLRDIETHFFDTNIVQQALSLYRIPQALWSLIIRDLQAGSRDIPSRIRAKTAHMVHDPFNYPLQKGPVAEILKQTLYELFIETMNRYAVGEQPVVRLIFDYIFSRQLPTWVPCLGDEVMRLAPRFE